MSAELHVPDELARLRRDNERLRRINAALMDRVEQSTSSPNCPLGYFQINAALSAQVVQQQAALREAVERAESANRAKSEFLGLEVSYEWPLPETIETDPTRLRQILVNLVGNAIKFTEIGHVCVCVRLTRVAGQPAMCFEVVDTGIGLSQEQIACLFQPFVQVDSSLQRKHSGTGLGLVISKRMAELLSVTLSVESEPGVGSRFCVTIACGRLAGVALISQFQTADPAAAPSEHRPVPGQLVGVRVLLAEDGLDNQRLISHLLRRAGADLEIADNGHVAVHVARAAEQARTPFDVVVMDMQMPVMDGYEATRLLRAGRYLRPIIALTAHAMSGDAERCFRAGCDSYQTKPIDRHKLIAAIATCAQRSAAAEQLHACPASLRS